MINLSDLKLNENNPRLIREDKFKKLVASIKDFPKMMELRPIVIDKDMNILGGNMRFRALQEAGYNEIDDSWVKIADKLTDEEKKRFVIEDNMPFGEWDWDILANNFEVGDLLDWGFNENELKIEQEVVEDEVPEVSDKPAVSKLGEVYQLGRHRLMCGDATKIEDVEKLMNGQKADIFIGDPPYGMRLDTNYSGMHGMHRGKNHEQVIGDDEDFDVNTIMPTVGDIAKQIWFGADYYAKSLGDTEHSGSWAVWDKRVEESQDAGFGSCFELFWSKEKHKRMIYRFQWAGFFTQGEKRDFDHPTEKSVRLISKILEDYGKDAVNVLDLFLGSGSTLIACEQTNRICYGMEIDPKYVDVIRKRYAKFIGKENEWQTL